MPIKDFDKVYLVDLCPSLCKVAEARFQRRGWRNVQVVCEDASTFKLPGLANPDGKVSLITMSYSRKFTGPTLRNVLTITLSFHD